MQKVAALFVHRRSIYKKDERFDAWDEERDARRYNGPHPVIAHPPCNTWVPVSRCNYPKGAAPPYGLDDGCFRAAIAAVQRWGGVLEHPAKTQAWRAFGLLKPPAFGNWYYDVATRMWIIEVDQLDFGHRARKRTWLAYSGNAPPVPYEIDPAAKPVSFQRLSKKQRVATPPRFKDWLYQLASMSAGR